MRLWFFLFLFMGLVPVLQAEDNASVKGFSYNSQVVVNRQELPDGALVAMDQTADVAKNIARQIVLTGGTVGSVPVAMRFSVVEEPKHGTLDKAGLGSGTVIYQPAPNFLGEDSFSFAVDAGGAVSKPARVSLKVIPQSEVAAPAPQVGAVVPSDEFTQELNKKSAEFFKEQREKRADFIKDFKPSELSPEEQQKRLVKFRQDETKRERKFREKQQQLIEKHGQDSFLEESKDFGDEVTLFLKLRDPSREELEKQKDDFLEKEESDRTDFFLKLQGQDLTSEEKIQKINDFQEKALKKRVKFFEARREIIAKQALDPDADKKTDEQLIDQIDQFFKDLI